MLKLNSLSSGKTRAKSKRVGRGYGSGKGGHTVGRGQKGQKSRSKISLDFAGTKRKKSWIKRLPLLRGRGRLGSRSKQIPVNLDLLAKHFKVGEKVTRESLVKKRLIKKSDSHRVKIVSNGKINKKLIVSLPLSQKAKEKIIKAKGRVIEEKPDKSKLSK